MKNKFTTLVSVLLALVFALAQFDLVSAKPGGPNEDVPGYICQASASVLTGPAPLTVQFVAETPFQNSAINWGFDDGMSGIGHVVEHTFVAEGEYKVRGWESDDGFYNACNLLIIKVTHATDNTDTTTNDSTDNDNGNPGGSSNNTGSGLAIIGIDQSDTDTVNSVTTGDNSPSVNVTGDSNLIIIQPTAPQTVQQAVDTTPKSFFWQLIHSLLAPFASWDKWVIEHH